MAILRMELSTVLLLTRLIKKVKYSFDNLKFSEFYWTDLTIVLHWIKGESSRWRWVTYVADRVERIKAISSSNAWSQIKSLDNPPDLITRNMLPSELIKSSIWCRRPNWLLKDEYPHFYEEPEEVPEQKKTTLICQSIEEFELVNRFSSITKLVNATAYCSHFRYRKTTMVIDADERQHDMQKLVQLEQDIYFSHELKLLIESHLISKKSSFK